MSGIQFEVNNGIGTLTLDVPQTRSALSSALLDELSRCLDGLPPLDVLIITGSGKSFVAGADLREMLPMDGAQALAYIRGGHAVFSAIEELACPVIAVINGYALGGGCELALACDLRIASNQARIGLPEVGLGIIPGFGGTQRLAAAIGPARAREMIFTGRILNAEEALAMGLVSQVTEPEALMTAAMALAEAISRNSPFAVRQAKRALRTGEAAGRAEGLRAEPELIAACFEAGDQKEGMTAFLEKRKPQWRRPL